MMFPLAPSSSMFAALNELWSVWVSEVCPFRKLDESLRSVYGEELGVGLQAKHRFLDSQETGGIHEPQYVSLLCHQGHLHIYFTENGFMHASAPPPFLQSS